MRSVQNARTWTILIIRTGHTYLNPKTLRSKGSLLEAMKLNHRNYLLLLEPGELIFFLVPLLPPLLDVLAELLIQLLHLGGLPLHEGRLLGGSVLGRLWRLKP